MLVQNELWETVLGGRWTNVSSTVSWLHAESPPCTDQKVSEMWWQPKSSKQCRPFIGPPVKDCFWRIAPCNDSGAWETMFAWLVIPVFWKMFATARTSSNCCLWRIIELWGSLIRSLGRRTEVKHFVEFRGLKKTGTHRIVATKTET